MKNDIEIISDCGSRGSRIIKQREGWVVCRYTRGVKRVHGDGVFNYGYWIGNKPCFTNLSDAKDFAEKHIAIAG